MQAPYYRPHVPQHLRSRAEVNNYLKSGGWGKLHIVGDEEGILDGVRVFWAGVHHRSPIAVCVETVKGTVLITDSFFKYGNIEQGHYLGVMESMMEADATWARIRREGRIVASIYDPEVFTRHPGGAIA